MTQYTGLYDHTVLEEVSKSLSENPNQIQGVESARKVANLFLKKTLSRMKYRFVEVNYLKWKEIASSEILKNSVMLVLQ